MKIIQNFFHEKKTILSCVGGLVFGITGLATGKLSYAEAGPIILSSVQILFLRIAVKKAL